MRFKDFIGLPGRILAGLSRFLLGDYRRKTNGSINETASTTYPGVVGTILDFVKFLGRTITNIIQYNMNSISAAFWMSLLVGGAAALAVAYWPAALAAVVNYSVAGYSIAALVGADFAAQIAATGVAGAVLGSAAIYALTTVANVLEFLHYNMNSISAAFGMSLLVGGAAALAVAYWPAALAAVVNYSVAGYSIAALVGADFAAQVAATGVAGAVLGSAALYALTAVANVFEFLVQCCCTKQMSSNEADFDETNDTFDGSASKLRQLARASCNRTVQPTTSISLTAPIHTGHFVSEPRSYGVAHEEGKNTTSVFSIS
jgi:hypothetical protein